MSPLNAQKVYNLSINPFSPFLSCFPSHHLHLEGGYRGGDRAGGGMP